MSNIYLFSLAYSQGRQLAVRAGYFGLCVKGDAAAQSWTCASAGAELQSFYGDNADFEHLIGIASRFKSGMVFPGLLYVPQQIDAEGWMDDGD